MSTRRTFLLQAVATAAASSSVRARSPNAPVRIALVGLVHDHARGFLPTVLRNPDVELCGIVESNLTLFDRYAREFNLKPSVRFDSLDALFAKIKIDAVATFTSTLGHRAVVEAAAAHRVHVMVEKPLATTLADARSMAAIAGKAGIELIVNYETSFYPSTRTCIPYVTKQHGIGNVRRIVLRAGHEGPAYICSSEFLAWLTDPIENGGGALMDFGCYGANLAACLLPALRPIAVSAVTQSFQPKVYPKVEDEANLLIIYPEAVVVVEASWNWPRDQKELDVYGTDAELHQPDRDTLILRRGDVIRGAGGKVSFRDKSEEQPLPTTRPDEEPSTPLAYLIAVAGGDLKPSGAAALDTNLLVMEILEAAKESARSKRQVLLKSPSA
ncbi:MAG: Gfo/Idh/MocA family oxidoreductase [Proteobacteria bacterium]|nr:Gfo/Idh/MocA family oxidoreductase [Pseudomonadota bacterium]